MSRTDIFAATIRHFLAPIVPFLDDPNVSEIMINTSEEIYIERDGALVKTEAKFDSQEAFMAAVNNVLQYTGKRLTPEYPLQDSRLPDGSRVHVILAPLSRRGTCMTIRKFAKVMFDAEHLTELGTWTDQVKEYIDLVVQGEKNLLVAGGTSSGKTCLLNVLSGFIPAHQRIVVIEDSAELALQQDHVVSLESRGPDRYGRGEVTIRDLFRSGLRLRPDRIIIGECRGGEAMEIIQAMTSGHAGSMSTLHANSPLDTLNRLETMCMMAKMDLPLYALRAQITSGIDVLLQMTRFNDGRREVTAVSEVMAMVEGQDQVRDVFVYDLQDGEEKGRLVWSGQKSQYGREPRMRVLHSQAKLTEGIFDFAAQTSPAGKGGNS